MINNIEQLQSSCTKCPVPKTMKDELCYICATEHMLEGKWKLMILWLLRDSTKRFSELLSEIPQVKQGPLANQLKSLEKNGLIIRKSYNQIPPKVEYSLSQKGDTFVYVLNCMEVWAKENLFPIKE